MSVHISHQIIEKEGKPLFVLVPYETYIKTMHSLESSQDATIPHRVVELTVLENKSPVRAWREYKEMTQKDMATKLKISQSAYCQMEKPDTNLRSLTLKKIARALKIKPEQLDI